MFKQVLAILLLAGSASAEIVWNEYYTPDMPASAMHAGATRGHTIACLTARDAVSVQRLVRAGDESGFLRMYEKGRCEYFEPGLEYFTETAQSTVAKHGMFLIHGSWQLRWTTLAVFNQKR